MEFLQFMFQSFWHFIGCAMILGGLGNLIGFLYNRPMRHYNIRKHGWPPSHCDADGDFKKKED